MPARKYKIRATKRIWIICFSPGFVWLLARSWLLGMVGRKMHKVGIDYKHSTMFHARGVGWKIVWHKPLCSHGCWHRLGQSDLPQLGGGMCFRAGASWIHILFIFKISCGFQVWTAHVSGYAYEGYGRRTLSGWCQRQILRHPVRFGKSMP